MSGGGARGSRSRLQGDRDAGATPEIPEELDFDRAGLRLGVVVDQFDNMNFPRQGYFLGLDYFASREDLGAASDYDRVAGFLGAATSYKRHPLLGLANLTSALGSNSTDVQTLGRLFALSGSRPEEVVGRYGGSLALLYLYEAGKLPTTLGNGIYLGASFEAGNLWNDSAQVDLGDLEYSVSLSLGLDTIFGPVYLAQAFNEDGRGITYLFVGRTF